MNFLAKIRLACSALILVGAAMLSDADAAAAGMHCDTCVHTCPSDLEQFCEDRGCLGHFAVCEPAYPEQPANCYPFTNWQVSCDLI